jgi:hypothetical protein
MNLNNIPLWHMEKVWKTDEFQEWWLKRWHDPKEGSMSNIRIGDMFTLGKDNQVGLITGKIIICSPRPGPEFQYHIAGDIGGHWFHPGHEWFETQYEGTDYVRFIPGPSCLAEHGKMAWARELLEHFDANPMDNTSRGHLAWVKRMRKQEDDAFKAEVSKAFSDPDG